MVEFAAVRSYFNPRCFWLVNVGELIFQSGQGSGFDTRRTDLEEGNAKVVSTIRDNALVREQGSERGDVAI